MFPRGKGGVAAVDSWELWKCISERVGADGARVCVRRWSQAQFFLRLHFGPVARRNHPLRLLPPRRIGRQRSVTFIRAGMS
jgi:hypothetical protein